MIKEAETVARAGAFADFAQTAQWAEPIFQGELRRSYGYGKSQIHSAFSLVPLEDIGGEFSH